MTSTSLGIDDRYGMMWYRIDVHAAVWRAAARGRLMIRLSVSLDIQLVSFRILKLIALLAASLP